jgi:hypothetical protein
MLRTEPDQILKEYIDSPGMCDEQEPDPLSSSTAVTGVSSPAARQASDGSCRQCSNEKLDTEVSELVSTITMQMSSLDVIQAAWIATDNPAVFTQQVRAPGSTFSSGCVKRPQDITSATQGPRYNHESLHWACTSHSGCQELLQIDTQ